MKELKIKSDYSSSKCDGCLSMSDKKISICSYSKETNFHLCDKCCGELKEGL